LFLIYNLQQAFHTQFKDVFKICRPRPTIFHSSSSSELPVTAVKAKAKWTNKFCMLAMLSYYVVKTAAKPNVHKLSTNLGARRVP